MAQLIKLYDENPDPRQVNIIVRALKDGALVVYPTDTVYGLGCDITNTKAVEKLARLRGIKLEKSALSFICHDLSHLSHYTRQIDTPTYKLLKSCLPGPYTFIFPSGKELPKHFKEKKTVGIRVPDNNIIRTIVKELGNPVMSTSVKDKDEIIEYMTDPELIAEEYENIADIVIDGGPGNNVPSTVVSLCGEVPEIIREGAGPLDGIFIAG